MNIKELADQAGLNFSEIAWVFYENGLAKFADLVAAQEAVKWDAQTDVEIHEAVLEEREECAKVCMAVPRTGAYFAGLIRARSKA